MFALLLIKVNSTWTVNYHPLPLEKAYLLENLCTFKTLLVLNKAVPFNLSGLAVILKPLSFLFSGAIFNLPAFFPFSGQDSTLGETSTNLHRAQG